MERRKFLRAGAALSALSLTAVALAGCADPFPTLTYAERPCYRTLGAVDCHVAPLSGEESRRVGFYDQPVAVGEEPWPQRLF